MMPLYVLSGSRVPGFPDSLFISPSVLREKEPPVSGDRETGIRNSQVEVQSA